MRWLFVFIVLLAPLGAVAEEKKKEKSSELQENPFPPRFSLPQGYELKTPQGTHQCFVARDYLTIVRMYTAFTGLYDWQLKTKGEIAAYQLTITSLKRTIADQGQLISTYQKDREWMQLRIAQSHQTIDSQGSVLKYERFVWAGAVLVLAGFVAFVGS